MIVSPKPLQDGWFKRCSLNAVKLSIRSPAPWILIYFGIPLISLYLPYTPITLLSFACIAILGTFLCFKQDHLPNYSVFDFLSVFIVRPQPLLFLFVVVAISIRAESYTPPETFLEFAGHLSMTAIIFWFSFIFAPLVIVVFYDFPRVLYQIYKDKKNGTESDESFSEIEFFGRFSPYAIHLSVDTTLNWRECCELSEQGIKLILRANLFSIFIFSIPLYLIFIFPLTMGFGIPFYYCVYRELFWQEGITDRKPEALAPAQSNT